MPYFHEDVTSHDGMKEQIQMRYDTQIMSVCLCRDACANVSRIRNTKKC